VNSRSEKKNLGLRVQRVASGKPVSISDTNSDDEERGGKTEPNKKTGVRKRKEVGKRSRFTGTRELAFPVQKERRAGLPDHLAPESATRVDTLT